MVTGLLILVLIALTSIGLASLAPKQSNPHRSKRVFTWIAKPINETLARWAHDLHFTDVVVRYVTIQEAYESMQSLREYEIRFWRLVNCCDVALACDSYEEFVDYLAVEQELSPSRLLLLDDTMFIWIYNNQTVYAEFLDACRTFKENVILGYGASWADFTKLYQHNLTNLTFHLYDEVDKYIIPYATHIGNKSKQLGLTLWVWGGWGWSWETMLPETMKITYQTAIIVGAHDFTVWNGYEDNTHELNMTESSLYNYPQHWHLIEEENRKFLEDTTT